MRDEQEDALSDSSNPTDNAEIENKRARLRALAKQVHDRRVGKTKLGPARVTRDSGGAVIVVHMREDVPAV